MSLKKYWSNLFHDALAGHGGVVGVDGEGVDDAEVPGHARALAGDGRRGVGAPRAGPLRVGDGDGAAVRLVVLVDDHAVEVVIW